MSFYPVFVAGTTIRIPSMTWNKEREEWDLEEESQPSEVSVLPVDPNGVEKVWTCSPETARSELDDMRVEADAHSRVEIYKKYRPNQKGALPGTWWSDPGYSASESGTKVLKDLFAAKKFDFPKSVNLVADCLRVCGLTRKAPCSITSQVPARPVMP